MSTFLANDLASTGLFRDELLQIATDGSKRVRRLAHLHSVYRDYWDQPRANISRVGKVCGVYQQLGEQDRRDVFIVKIPPPRHEGGGGGQSLVISSIASSNVSATGATVTWNTNLASDTQVEYGTTTSYGLSTTLNTSLVTSHNVALSGLTASATYHYRVKSKDASGNAAVSGDHDVSTIAAGGGGGRLASERDLASIVNCTASAASSEVHGPQRWHLVMRGLSQQSISSGDDYLEFTAGETNTTRFCGLARNPSATDYSLIDFSSS